MKGIHIIFNDSSKQNDKELNIFYDLWPYKPKSDKILWQIVIFTILIIVTLPHIFGIYKHCSRNLNICSENIAELFYYVEVISTYILSIVLRKKLKKVHKEIKKNYLEIVDFEEQLIMNSFLKYGRLKSAWYFGFCIIGGILFGQVIIVPVIFDIFLPLNHSRNKMLMTNAEYFFNPYDHYCGFYILYCISIVVSINIRVSMDSMFMIIVHHNLGMFAIVKHRLLKATIQKDENVSYKAIISSIHMHEKSLKFAKIVDSAYKYNFIPFSAASIVFLSRSAAIITEHEGKFSDLSRTLLFEIGAVVHMFYLIWPGQLIIESSEDLFLSACMSNWYNLSKKGKTLIKIMMIRCLKPCYLNIAGIGIMNFENFTTCLKTTLSYMAVVMSS